MKVKALIDKFHCSSNAEVVIKCVGTKETILLHTKTIHNNTPEYILNMRANGFNVVGNIVTIYAV